MVERALSALLAQHRRAEIDSASARAYEEQTVDTLDVWATRRPSPRPQGARDDTGPG